jgi:hypothetical protein
MYSSDSDDTIDIDNCFTDNESKESSSLIEHEIYRDNNKYIIKQINEIQKQINLIFYIIFMIIIYIIFKTFF